MGKKLKLEKTTVVAELEIELTDDEKRERAHRCVGLIDQLDKSETEFKEIKKEWNDKHKELRGEIRELSLAHVTGREFREVECDQVYDLPNKRAWYAFNGKKYGERDMTDYEVAQIKQGNLLNDGANAMDAAGVKHSKPDDNNDQYEDHVVPPPSESTLRAAPM